MPTPPRVHAVFSKRSGNRLTPHDLDRFPSRSLFDRLGRTMCAAGCLPRKELFEAWEMARRIRRLYRGGRVVDLAGGHGVLAQVLLLLDDSSPAALVADTVLPPSAATLHAALVAEWPRLRGRVTFLTARLEEVALTSDDLVVSCHACGALTDQVLERAAEAGARVAVLPCCHDARTCDAGALRAWMDVSLAIDSLRVVRLEDHGYQVHTHTIPAEVTPKNRLLLGSPSRRGAPPVR